VNASIASATDDGALDFVTLCRVAWRHKYLIAAVALFTTLVAIAYALLATPYFRGEAVIIEAGDRAGGDLSSLAGQLGGLAGLAGVELPLGDQGKEAQAVLRSRDLAQQFVSRYELTNEFAPKRPPAQGMWFAVEALRNKVMKIRDDKRAGTVIVSFDWTDPAQAAKWANDFVALANDQLRARAIADSSRNITYLREQAKQTDVVELQKVMYRLIESETKTLMLANGRIEYAFSVVDPAVVPQMRVRPRRKVIAMIGLAIGALLGTAAALMYERIRARPAPLSPP
jgi:uncharacterized protein involved in exopolysaccharide biosynthesis